MGPGTLRTPEDCKTDYLWKKILTKPGLTDILENYAQIVEEKDEKGRRNAPRSSPATTSLTWSASCWPTYQPATLANAT